MRTLEQIKDDYAKEKGYSDWDKLIDLCVSSCYTIELNEHVDQICVLAQKEALKNASESVTTVHHEMQSRENIVKAIELTKHSILNENNIIK